MKQPSAALNARQNTHMEIQKEVLHRLPSFYRWAIIMGSMSGWRNVQYALM